MNEESTIKSRVKHLLKEKSCSLIELGGTESQRCKLSRQINGNIGISLNTVNAILLKFPEVSAEWLLRGNGTMDKLEQFAPSIHAGDGSIVQNGINNGDATICTPSQFELYSKDVVIAAKDAEIAALNNLITELKSDKQNLHLLLQAFTHK